MTLSGRTKPTKTNNALYATPAFVSGDQFGQQLIPEAPGTNSFQPTNGGTMAITPYTHVRIMMNATLHLGIFVLLLTLLMTECITRLIAVKLAMEAIPTEPLINPDQMHRVRLLRTLSPEEVKLAATTTGYPKTIIMMSAIARFIMNGVMFLFLCSWQLKTNIVSTLPTKPTAKMTAMTTIYTIRPVSFGRSCGSWLASIVCDVLGA